MSNPVDPTPRVGPQRSVDDPGRPEWQPAGIGSRTPGDLPRALRPREKLLSRSAACLTSGELVGLILGSGTGRLAERLVRGRGLARLAALDVGAWRSIDGIGDVSAARMCAVFELGRRTFAGATAAERPRVNRPSSAFEHVRHLGTAKKEHLVGLYLDAQNGLLHRETISMGSLNTTRTHPREILYPAVVHLALGFILIHNHPSGCLEPSPEDIEFTVSVRNAGKMMGIELYDHLIVAGARFVSLRERGVF